MSYPSQHTQEPQSDEKNDRRWSAFESLNTSNSLNNSPPNSSFSNTTAPVPPVNPFKKTTSATIDQDPGSDLVQHASQQKANNFQNLHTMFPVPFSDLNSPESADGLQNAHLSNPDSVPSLLPKLQIDTNPIPSVAPLFSAKKPSSTLLENDTKPDLPKLQLQDSQLPRSPQQTAASSTATAKSPFHIPRKPIDHKFIVKDHAKRHSISGSIVQPNFDLAPTPPQPQFYAPQPPTSQDYKNGIRQEQQTQPVFGMPPSSPTQHADSVTTHSVSYPGGPILSSGLQTQSEPEPNSNNNANYLKIVYGQEQQLPQHPPDPARLNSRVSISRRYSRIANYNRHDASCNSLPDVQASEIDQIEKLLRRHSLLSSQASSTVSVPSQMTHNQQTNTRFSGLNVPTSLENRRRSWAPSSSTPFLNEKFQNCAGADEKLHDQVFDAEKLDVSDFDHSNSNSGEGQQSSPFFAVSSSSPTTPTPGTINTGLSSNIPLISVDSTRTETSSRPLSLVIPSGNNNSSSNSTTPTASSTLSPTEMSNSPFNFRNGLNTEGVPSTTNSITQETPVVSPTNISTQSFIPPIPKITHNYMTSSSINPALQRAPSAPEAAVSSAARRHYPLTDQLSPPHNLNLAHRRIPSNSNPGIGRAASTSATSTLLNNNPVPPLPITQNNSPSARPNTSDAALESSLSRNSSITSSNADQTFGAPWDSNDAKIELHDISVKQNSGAWHEYWNIPIERINEFNEYDVQYQSELHSFIQQEENYVNGLHVFLDVFCDDKLADTISSSSMRKKFVDTLFEPLKKIVAINNQYLLMPFIKQQMTHKHTTPEQPNPNPFLDFLVPNVIEWLDNVKAPFLVFAKEFPLADSITKEQMETNEKFTSFLNAANEKARTHSGKDFSSLMHSTRIRFGLYKSHFQRLAKLLTKKQGCDDCDHEQLLKDKKTIEGLNLCVAKIDVLMKELNEIQRHEESRLLMQRYEQIFKFKYPEDQILLNFSNHTQIAEKQAYRKKKNSSWDTHLITVILLDHFLFLVRKISYNEWQVLERPIHMDLLRLENLDDPPIYKNTGAAVIAAVRRQPTHAPSAHIPRSSRPTSLSQHTPSQHKPSVSSISSTSTNSSTVNQNQSLTPVQTHTTQGNIHSPVLNGSENSVPLTPSTPSFKSTGSTSSLTSSPTNSSMSSPTTTTSSVQFSDISSPSSSFPTPSTPKNPVAAHAMVVDLAPKQNDKLIYPVRIRNIENDHKCRIAFDRQLDRKNFIDLLLDTKRKYAESQLNHHKVPLGLKVLDQSSFPFTDISETLPSTVYTYGDVVDVALEEAGKFTGCTPVKGTGTNGLINVNCALHYSFSGEDVIFVGTSLGLYYARLIKSSNGKLEQLNWKISVQLPNVTHIEVCQPALFILSSNRLVYLKLNEILVDLLSPKNRLTQTVISQPVTVSDSVECFHTGVLGGEKYLFYANKSTKGLEKTDVFVYAVTTTGSRESQRKGFSRLFKGHESPFAEVLQKPTLIAHELFSPTKIHGFSFFGSYFFFLTTNSFDHLKLNVRNPTPLPRADTVSNVLHNAGFSDAAISDFKTQLQNARTISVSFMHWDRRPSQGQPSSARSNSAVSVNDESRNSSSSGLNTAPPTNNQPNLIHCFHKFAVMSVRNGDLYVPPGHGAGSAGSGMGACKPFRIQYLHKAESAYLWYPYLLLFSPQLIEVRLVTAHNLSQSLVQVITGRNIKLLTCDRSSQPPVHGGSHSHGSPRIIISMAHPDPSIHTTVIMEIVRNHGVSSNEKNLRGSLFDIGQY